MKSPTEEPQRQVQDGFDLLHASLLLQEGRMDDAESLLLKNGFPPNTVEAMDLLARIQIQKGDDDQARSFWMLASKMNPGFLPAQDALAVLATPWRVRMLAVKSGIALACSTVFVLAIFGCATLFDLALSKPEQVSSPMEPGSIQAGLTLEELRNLPNTNISIKIVPNIQIFDKNAELTEEGKAWVDRVFSILFLASPNFDIRAVVRASPDEVANEPEVIEKRSAVMRSAADAYDVSLRAIASGLVSDYMDGKCPYFGLTSKPPTNAPGPRLSE